MNAMTFVVPVGSRKILETNFLASPCLLRERQSEILVQTNFESASKAYNDGIDRARNDLLGFVHQDVILPQSWFSQLRAALDYLQEVDPAWGVLGCYGVTREDERWGHVFSTGWGVLGGPFDHPVAVQTLDEVILILRRSSGLRFDEELPHFHLYGTDVCMTAASRGLRCYAIPAFCIHNTDQLLVLPKEFYDCYKHIRHVWKNYLPIQTSCIRISRFDMEMRMRRLKEFYFRLSGKSESRVRRAEDPQQLLDQFQETIENLCRDSAPGKLLLA